MASSGIKRAVGFPGSILAQLFLIALDKSKVIESRANDQDRPFQAASDDKTFKRS
jgi:hypothetical protein